MEINQNERSGYTIPTPESLRKFTPEEELQLDAVARSIVGYLRQFSDEDLCLEQFIPAGDVRQFTTYEEAEALRHELIKRFRKSGWLLEYTGSLRSLCWRVKKLQTVE